MAQTFTGGHPMKSHQSPAAVLFSFLLMMALAMPSVITANPRISSGAAPAPAQTRFFITITPRSGKFKGEGHGPKDADKMIGLKFVYEVNQPYDPLTGRTSKRQHRPLVVTKEWGAASPQLFQALVDNETLTSVVFEFVRVDQKGEEQVYQIITLTNAVITNIKLYTDSESSSQLEDVAFAFQQIDIKNVPGNTVVTDNLRLP
jgi:type VI secretion system secreted protein Hcp